MRTIKYILFVISFISLISLISCTKDKLTTHIENVLPINKSSKVDLIRKLNEYSPANNIASEKFSTFTKIKNSGTLKNSSEDIRLDEGVWLTEAYVNFEKGFRDDSIERVSMDTTRYILEIKNWDGQYPIIENESFDALIDTILLRIEIDRRSDYMFWATYIEVETIDEDNATLLVINASGPKSSSRATALSPKVPGTYLQPFPYGYNTQAGYPSVAMLWAERDFWDKIAGEKYYIDGHYTLVLVSHFTKSAYIAPGVANPKLFWGYGSCESYWMNSQQLNQYLLSSKQLIDENSPIVAIDDLIIGYFHWYCFNTGNTIGPSPDSQWTNKLWFQHLIDFFIYKKVYYNPPVE